MDAQVKEEFGKRIETFLTASNKGKGQIISIKIRTPGHCFCREHHAPNACRIIDQQLESYVSQIADFSFKEHETGPELLVYVAMGTSCITLVASIINLITAIIKARSDGIDHGDPPYDYIELIVRGFNDNGKIKEETVVKIESREFINKELIEKTLQKKISELLRVSKKK
jgi:hypothetical protein